MPKALSTTPRAIRDRLKRYGDLDWRKAVTTSLADIKRDVALAEEHNITTPNLPQLKDWSVGLLNTPEFDRQLEILQFDDTTDPLVVGQFGSADDGRDIWHDIKQRMWPSLAIALPTFILGLLVNITLAMLIAFFRGTYLDIGGVVLAVVSRCG